MVHLLRKYQQPLLICVTILVIIAFVGYWNTNQSTRGGGGGFGTASMGTIYGRNVRETDFAREARKFDIARALGLIDMLQSLAGHGYDMNEVITDYVWNSMVLRHEADALQIIPTSEEMQAALAGLPTLQTNGQFDRTKLDAFVQNILPSRGFTDTVIDDLVRDDLVLKKVRTLVGSSIETAPAEFRAAYAQVHEKASVSVVRFLTADLAASVQISDDDAKKAFEARKDSFKSDEKRTVSFVTFALTDAQLKLTGKERIDTLQKLANRAAEFSQAVLEKGAKFPDVAAKFGVPVATAPDLTQTSTGMLPPAAVAAAFQITEKDPNSDPVEAENGFHVLHLEKITPSQPLTFEQAKPRVIEQIRNERAGELAATKAAEARKKIDEALKAGKSFAEAATAAGVRAESVPAFSLADPPKEDVPDQDVIMQKTADLGVQQLSDFTPTAAGGLLVYVEKREGIDEAQFEKDKAAQMPRFEEQKRAQAFQEWLRTRREAAKLKPAHAPAAG